ncbi:MAG: type II secretion system protein GspM [Pseudomonadota bacterium]|nr:type II secretion system protein GspM [Pseudomonadota bacterium]
MNRLAALRPEQLWLAAAALILAVLMAMGMGYVLRKHQWATDTLQSAEPRVARLNGLLQNEELLAQAQSALNANLNEFVYPADRDPGEIGNAALQRVREMAAGRGLRVASSQATLTPRDEQGFDRIGLDLRIEGDWNAVFALLRDLADARPALYLGLAQFTAQGTGEQGRPQTIAAQLGLFVLRQRPS